MKFLHKGECNYTEKALLVHFISMQLNFPVLSIFSCVAPQNAGFIYIFIENRIFPEKMVPQNIFTTGYFMATFFVYRQNKKKR